MKAQSQEAGMSEMKPCPFCGGEATRQENALPHGGTTYETGCDNVGCSVLPSAMQLSQEYADEAWNIRALSAAMELHEVRALVEAARKMLVAAELREIYHRLPNDKNRIGDPKSPKAKARDAWLKAFRRASSATSLALAAIKEPKT